MAKLGFYNLTRHGLRHTGASWLADAGIALHVLQKILGHQSMEPTKDYLQPTTGTSRRPHGRPTWSSPHHRHEGSRSARQPPPVSPAKPAPTLRGGAGASPARRLVHSEGPFWSTSKPAVTHPQTSSPSSA
ncbi:tyrosine-type recombinase/integrase [Bogoriella caseilytica]|uniref:tyrosine-type recombinase/integrase n=1 Tax=Bogoriella caseilytica TaxID=56055 RepID=UPI001FE47299|nr:tyrosine-type recombinase/integrase [Bogoriella caseilytica]